MRLTAWLFLVCSKVCKQMSDTLLLNDVHNRVSVYHLRLGANFRIHKPSRCLNSLNQAREKVMTFTLEIWQIVLLSVVMLIGCLTILFFIALQFASKIDNPDPKNIPAHWMWRQWLSRRSKAQERVVSGGLSSFRIDISSVDFIQRWWRHGYNPAVHDSLRLIQWRYAVARI